MGFKPRKVSVTGTAQIGHGMPVKKNVINAFAQIGGFNNAKHLAMASTGIYLQTIESNRTFIKDDPGVWPQGWTVIGDGWYDSNTDISGRTGGLMPNRDTIHAAAVLEWQKQGTAFQKGDIMIVCRGTDFGLKIGGRVEAKSDINIAHKDFKHPKTGKTLGKVHAGFYDVYNSVFLGKISGNLSLFEFVLKKNPPHIYVTGHSLGGAMSHLCALGLDLLAKGLGIQTEVRVCSFAAPKVCNHRIPPAKLKQEFANSGIKGIAVVNELDPVPFLPGASGSKAILLGALSSIRFSGNPVSNLKNIGFVAGGALGGVLNLIGGLASGIWNHPEFIFVTFADTGRVAGASHPHSMDVYQKIMQELAVRLD